LVPRCLKKFTYELPNPDEDADDKRTLYTIIKNASKLEISNIQGTESNLNRIRVLADNVGKQCRYLHLEFEDGDV